MKFTKKVPTEDGLYWASMWTYDIRDPECKEKLVPSQQPDPVWLQIFEGHAPNVWELSSEFPARVDEVAGWGDRIDRPNVEFEP